MPLKAVVMVVHRARSFPMIPPFAQNHFPKRTLSFVSRGAAHFRAQKMGKLQGQSNLTSLLKEAFTIFASRTEFIPDVEPARYRLFQVADIACTLELSRAKLLSQEGLSESEIAFFGGVKKFKKNYLKLLDRQRVN